MIFSICIPTYNRRESLDNCLNSILISNRHVTDFKYEICVSDNCSEDDISKIIKKYDRILNIKFNKNNTNLGFALNAIKCVSMAKGKFVWMIGNDDLVLPQTLLNIKNLILENPDVDYFFANSYYLNSDFLDNFSKPFNTKYLQYDAMKKISKLKNNKKVEFWEIINPKVSWEFLIGIFLSIFNREKWEDHKNILNYEDLKDTRPWSNFDNTCLHPKIISTAFKNSKSYICAEPLSVNLIGKREWFNLYEFVEIVRIPELLDYYRKQGLGLIRYLYCKNYSLRNFSNFFFKIMIRGDRAGFRYINFYRHFFRNLLYPNVYMSLIYFILRNLKKTIKYLIK
jgi:glycosyltransferase involved in cell wall biosynthesis